MPPKPARAMNPIDAQGVMKLVDQLFGYTLHAKRVLSLANAAVGVIASGSLAVSC